MNIAEIPNSAIIYLNPEMGCKLIEKAIKKAGSKRELVKNVLLYSGRSPDVTRLNKIMHGKQGIPKYRFVRLLKFLGISETVADKYIYQIKIKNK